jgi:hypothetical protein
MVFSPFYKLTLVPYCEETMKKRARGKEKASHLSLLALFFYFVTASEL